MKTIDRLIQRLQQTERDLASKQELTTCQLEKYKDDLTVKIEQLEKESKKQPALTRDDLISIDLHALSCLIIIM